MPTTVGFTNHQEISFDKFIEEMKLLNPTIVNDHLNCMPRKTIVDNVIYRMCVEIIIYLYINNINSSSSSQSMLLSDAVRYYTLNFKFNFIKSF